jgi:hypothetical protein
LRTLLVDLEQVRRRVLGLGGAATLTAPSELGLVKFRAPVRRLAGD